MRIQEDRIEGTIIGMVYGNTLAGTQTKDIPPEIETNIKTIKAYKEAVHTLQGDLINIDKDTTQQDAFLKELPEEHTNTQGILLGLLPYADEDLITMSTLTQTTQDDALASALLTVLIHHLAKDKVRPSTEGALLRYSIRMLDAMQHYEYLYQQEPIDKTELRSLLSEALIVLPEIVYSDPDEDICSFFDSDCKNSLCALTIAIATLDAHADSEEPLSAIQRLQTTPASATTGGALIGASRGARELKTDIDDTLVLEPDYSSALRSLEDYLKDLQAHI